MAGLSLRFTGVSLLLLLWASLVTGTQFQQSQVSVNESVGSFRVLLQRDSEATSNVTIAFMTLEAFSQEGSCRPTVWDVTVGNLTAEYDQAEVSDFLATTVLVTFAEGQMQASVNVVIMDDDIAEARESFVAVITSGGTDGDFCALLINIMDNDVVGVLFNAPELSTMVQSQLLFNQLSILKRGSHEPNITVNVGIRDSGSTTLNSDFNLTKTSFTLSSATEAAMVPIQILDGYSLAERIETIVLCLSMDTAQNEVQVELREPYCATIYLIDDGVTVVGYIGRGLQAHPRFEETEGNRMEICFGIVDGNMEPGFLDIFISLRPDNQTQADRISASRSSVLEFQIGPTPVRVQLASFFRQDCFTIEAIDNGLVDGHATFNLQIVAAVSSQPVIIIAENATLKVLDNDVSSFSLSSDPSVRENEELNLTISRGGPNTTLTYILSLRLQDLLSDFSYDPLVFEPDMDSKVSVLNIDDFTPQPLRVLTISIESTEIAGGREGLPPLTGDSIIVEVYDNDFAIGFSDSDLMITENTSLTLSLSILDPTGDNVDPLASFPLTLQLQRVDDSSGATLVTLDSTNIELSASNQSASIQLTAENDDLCFSGHRYRLSYTYTGSDAYTVLTNRKGEVNLQFVDDADCTDETTPESESTQRATAREVCIPCIVVPIVLILVLCCCFWWILILICLLCKKRCKWYHDYDLQNIERTYNENNSKTMIPLSEKKNGT